MGLSELRSEQMIFSLLPFFVVLEFLGCHCHSSPRFESHRLGASEIDQNIFDTGFPLGHSVLRLIIGYLPVSALNVKCFFVVQMIDVHLE